MKNISIKCPAKINLTLEVVNKRNDGYHNIKSVMQMINLYDYLDISAEPSLETQIILSGNNPDIPYDERNLVHKAAKLFLSKTGLSAIIKINIEKHIPVSAGLAGGSTDAAGTLYGLNKLFNNPLTIDDLHAMCSELGSDLNVCLNGGCILATGRGEKTKRLNTVPNPVTLIKPSKLGISAKTAYSKCLNHSGGKKSNKTDLLVEAINSNKNNLKDFLHNDLETAVFNDYPELQKIKKLFPESIMSGSGSTYFLLSDIGDVKLEGYDVISGLNFISEGVTERDIDKLKS